MRADGRVGSFEVTAMGPEAFVESARRAVAAMGLGVKVSVSLDGEQLVVAVERLGRSVLRYDLIPNRNGFAARLRSRRIAPMHLPFSDDFLETLTRVLSQVAGDGSPLS